MIRDEGGKLFARGIQVIAGNGESVDAIRNDVFPGSGMGGEDGRAGGHGFGDGEAEAFVPAECCHEGHALEEDGEFGAGALAVEDDALAEARRGNFFFEGPLVIAELGGGFADDDDGGGGVLF